MSQSLKSIVYGSCKLYYKILGSGIPVLLIHGYQSDGAIWEPIADMLKSKHLVIVPDLPGHGSSDYLPGLDSMGGYAQSVEAILRAESIKKFHVFGHSMGGYVALELAKKHASRILSLGLINSHPFADSCEKQKRRGQEIQAIRSGKAKILLSLCRDNHFKHVQGKMKEQWVESLFQLANKQSESGMVADLSAMKTRNDLSAFLLSKPFAFKFYLGEEDEGISIDEMKDIFSSKHIRPLKGLGHMSLIEDAQQIAVSMAADIKNQEKNPARL